jgi:addiction module HigA family antidote
VLGDELAAMGGLSYISLARILKIKPARHVREILLGKRAVTADTALRLGRYFRTSPELWMNLQAMYDLDLARQTIGEALGGIPQLRKARIF